MNRNWLIFFYYYLDFLGETPKNWKNQVKCERQAICFRAFPGYQRSLRGTFELVQFFSHYASVRPPLAKAEDSVVGQ